MSNDSEYHQRIRVLDTRPVYENAWIGVSESRVIHASGVAGIYGVVHFKNRAVGVIPYEAGDIWLVGQHRFPLGTYSWEIPKGGSPLGDDLERDALRELKEETGMGAERLELIVRMHLSNSVSDRVRRRVPRARAQSGCGCTRSVNVTRRR